MFKYAALQNINYDSLQLNHNALEHEQQGRSTPRSLQLQCCAALCEQGMCLYYVTLVANIVI